jgi:uncharacterized Ntn-hydrolase superfamily protein
MEDADRQIAVIDATGRVADDTGQDSPRSAAIWWARN